MKVKIVNKLKEKRLEKGFTQEQLCKAIGIKHIQQLGKLENNKKLFPRLTTAYKIAKVLNLKVEDIWQTKE